MSYNYQEQRPRIFTEDGFTRLTRIREYVLSRIKFSGAVMMNNVLMEVSSSGRDGSDWDKLACVDYLVERGEIREISQTRSVPGQARIFVAG